MSPEFDPKKNAANIAKHGVSLATGDGVLRDPLAITIEEIRLISVRSASAKERKSYEKGI